MLKKADIDRCFERLASSGDLAILYAIVTDARALVERELLQKLASYPVGGAEDLTAFAYRQGWLRALVQVQALFRPESVAQQGRGPSVDQLAFQDGALDPDR